jgi:Tol biopolymer transport system component
VQALCDASNGRGGTWNRDGIIAFAPAVQGALYEVSALGGTPVQVTSAKSGISHRLPHFLPDGKRLLFFSGAIGQKENGIYSLDLETRRVELVASEESEGLYVEPGYLVFVRGRNLMAQRFDARRLRTSGQAAPIAEQVLHNATRWTGAYSFSDTGLLVFQPGAGAVKSRLTWFDTDGKTLGTVGEPGDITFVSLSPDGNRALTEVMGADGRANLWMYDLGWGIGTPFTSGPGSYREPVWSPDAKSVVYDDRAHVTPDYIGPDGATEYELHRKASDDTSDVPIRSAGGIATSWSPDGRSLAFETGNLGTAMWILPMVGPGKPYPFVVTPVGEIGSFWKRGSFSPDGRWFSYLSDETGRHELFVAPFPGPGGKWQISSDGADAPQWVSGGTKLVYINAERKLVAVDVRTNGKRLETGQAHILFGGQPLPALPCAPTTYGAPVYLTADGKRILLPVPLLEGSSPALTLVTNWTAELKN